MNEWVREAVRTGALVVASHDWHPPDHISFRSRGGLWPPHCVQGSEGAELHPSLELPKTAVLVSKGQNRDKDAYSAFLRAGGAIVEADAGG